jgi:hypothetical protein
MKYFLRSGEQVLVLQENRVAVGPRVPFSSCIETISKYAHVIRKERKLARQIFQHANDTRPNLMASPV